MSKRKTGVIIRLHWSKIVKHENRESGISLGSLFFVWRLQSSERLSFENNSELKNSSKVILNPRQILRTVSTRLLHLPDKVVQKVELEIPPSFATAYCVLLCFSKSCSTRFATASLIFMFFSSVKLIYTVSIIYSILRIISKF